MAIQVDNSRCPGNHSCPAITVCPVDAIKQHSIEAPTVDQDLCIDCGKCVNFCPTGALQFQ